MRLRAVLHHLREGGAGQGRRRRRHGFGHFLRVVRHSQVARPEELDHPQAIHPRTARRRLRLPRQVQRRVFRQSRVRRQAHCAMTLSQTNKYDRNEISKNFVFGHH